MRLAFANLHLCLEVAFLRDFLLIGDSNMR